jgi:hypothetical protein
MALNLKTVSGVESEYMKHLKYHTLVETNKEFLRGDLWEFTFTNPPNVVYYPGDDIIQTRLVQSSIGTDTSVTGFEKHLRNSYIIYQQTGQQTAGQINLAFVDREDQAITYFIDDWKQKIANRDNKFSFRKEDLVAQCEICFLNTSRVPVRKMIFYNTIIQDGSYSNDGQAEDSTDRADVQLSLKFEHFFRGARKTPLIAGTP